MPAWLPFPPAVAFPFNKSTFAAIRFLAGAAPSLMEQLGGFLGQPSIMEMTLFCQPRNSCWLSLLIYVPSIGR